MSDRTIQEILIKLDHLESRIEFIEKKLAIPQPIDRELINRSCTILLKFPQVSTLLLQKEFGITKTRSVKLFNQLEEIGILKTIEVINDPLQPIKVGRVSKYKIKQYLEANS